MCEILTLLHEMPKKHGLSIEWLADHMGVNPSTLQRWLNPHDTLPFPLKKLIPFMKACNNDYSALDVLESRLGRTAVDLHIGNIKVNLQTIASLTKEAGEAITALAESIADGEIDEDERRVCIKELLDLQRIVTALLTKLNNAESYQ